MAEKINEIMAWVATNSDGDEGITGALTTEGTWMPLVGADTARIEALREVATQIAKQSGMEVKLVRFSVREDIETLPVFPIDPTTHQDTV